jgi:periplasmic copper chaperone A
LLLKHWQALGYPCAAICALPKAFYPYFLTFIMAYSPSIIPKFIAAYAVLTLTLPVFSHITLETGSAPAGSTYKAVFKVGHGCAGAATKAVRVQLPLGFDAAKPMPKAGWAISANFANNTSEVTWTAKSPQDQLPDAHYDEFSLRTKLPANAGAVAVPVWFKVLQSCDNGANDWSQIPETGTSTQGLKTPAALLMVEPMLSKPPVASPMNTPAAGHAHH